MATPEHASLQLLRMWSPRTFSTVSYGFGFALLPCLYAALVRWLAPMELVSINFSDPDYYYVVNAFLTSQFEFPRFVGHPGVPLQIFGGLLVRLKLALAPESTLPAVDELLRHAPSYYSLISNSLLALNAIALFHAGVFYRRLGLPFFAALMVQALFIASPLPRIWVGRIAPEAMHIFISVYAGIFLVRAISSGRPWVYSIFTGAAISLKLFYFPWALGAAAFSRQQAMKSLGLVTATFLGTFAFVWPVAMQGFRYYLALLTNPGPHGIGEPSFPDLATNSQNFLLLHQQEPTILLSLSFGLYCTALAFFFPKEEENRKAHFRETLVWAAMMLLAWIAVLKQPYSDNYLVPLLGFVPHLFAHVWRFSNRRGTLSLLMLAGIFLVVMVGMSHQKVTLLAQHRAKLADASRELATEIKDHPKCHLIVGGGIPLAAHALSVGIELADYRYTNDLMRLYPEITFFARETERGSEFRPFGSADLTEEELRSRLSGRCVLYAISGNETQFKSIPENYWSREGKLLRNGLVRVYYLEGGKGY